VPPRSARGSPMVDQGNVQLLHPLFLQVLVNRLGIDVKMTSLLDFVGRNKPENIRVHLHGCWESHNFENQGQHLILQTRILALREQQLV
jgi:hypothetical protein